MVSKEPEPKTARRAAPEVLEQADELLKTAEIARRVLEVKGVRLSGKTEAALIAALIAAFKPG